MSEYTDLQDKAAEILDLLHNDASLKLSRRIDLCRDLLPITIRMIEIETAWMLAKAEALVKEAEHREADQDKSI